MGVSAELTGCCANIWKGVAAEGSRLCDRDVAAGAEAGADRGLGVPIDVAPPGCSLQPGKALSGMLLSMRLTESCKPLCQIMATVMARVGFASMLSIMTKQNAGICS